MYLCSSYDYYICLIYTPGPTIKITCRGPTESRCDRFQKYRGVVMLGRKHSGRRYDSDVSGAYPGVILFDHLGFRVSHENYQVYIAPLNIRGFDALPLASLNVHYLM